MIEQSVVFHPLLVGGSRDSMFWQKYVLPLISDASFPGIFLDPSVPWQGETISVTCKAWDGCSKEAPDYEIVTRNVLSECVGILHRQQPKRQQNLTQAELRRNERMKTMLQFIQ